MSDFVKEGGHWYDEDGKPAYTQLIASGKNKGGQRPTTIRDARKQSLLPSVTTVLSILDKPALTHWKIGRAIDLLKWDIYQWMKEKQLPASIPSAFKLLFKAAQPDMENKAERGSEIHAAIEKWLEGGGIDEGYNDYIDIVQRVITELGIDMKDVVAERSFASELGYGGAVDFTCTLGDGIIIDFKTKDMDSEKCEKLKAYDEHVMQLGAYRTGMEMPRARLFNLFLSRDNPKVYKLIEWEEKEAMWGEKAFLSVFNSWKILRRYEPNG